jgi:hypothetical protein
MNNPKTLNFLPDLSGDDVLNQRKGNPEVFSKFCKCGILSRVAGAYFKNILAGKFCPTVIFSLPYFWMKMSVMRVSFGLIPPAFGFHIMDVVSLCPKEKVIGINARRIIAFMKHSKPIGYFSKSNHPRNAMSQEKPATNNESSVSVFNFASSPNPASVSFVNLFPKVFKLFRREVDRARHFCDGIFSVGNHNAFMVSMLAISRAQYAGDGDITFTQTRRNCK